MTRTFYSLSIVVATLAANTIPVAHAQPAPVVSPSYKQLVTEGFEVKAVTLIPTEALKAAGADSSVPNALVTLQRGPSTATCLYNLANWWNQLPASMEGTTQCSVYPPR